MIETGNRIQISFLDKRPDFIGRFYSFDFACWKEMLISLAPEALKASLMEAEPWKETPREILLVCVAEAEPPEPTILRTSEIAEIKLLPEDVETKGSLKLIGFN